MSKFSLQFAYQWLPISGNPAQRVYFSPTLRLLECRRDVILNELETNDKVTFHLFKKIQNQLMQIVDGGIILPRPQNEDAVPLCNFLENLLSDFNQAGVVLPPDLPGYEFKKWFPEFPLTPAQKQALSTSVHMVVLSTYAPFMIERGVTFLGQIAFIATIIFGSGAVAASLSNPLLAAFCFLLTAAGLMARASDLNRWKRLGRYLERVWAGTYYDKRAVLWNKAWKRVLIGLGVLMPIGVLAAHTFTMKGVLDGLFVLGEQLGLAPLLEHAISQALAFALFLIIVTGRVLKPLEYGLKNTVGPAFLSSMLSCFLWDRKYWKQILKPCMAYDCKRTEPHQEMSEYKPVAFQVTADLQGQVEQAALINNEWYLQRSAA